mgnify:CR=1 FL=1
MFASVKSCVAHTSDAYSGVAFSLRTSASTSLNDTVFGNEDQPAFAATSTTDARAAIDSRTGKIDKQQYNAKIYQPIGADGDFISISGHYNQNRNNFFGSVRLDNRFATPNGFPSDADEREYDINYRGAVWQPVDGGRILLEQRTYGFHLCA